jgi:hypothetical protein
VQATWLEAIKAGNYVTWPGLTSTAVRKHFPESDEMQQGHMKKQRQGVRSTKQQSNDESRTTSITKKMHETHTKHNF